MKKYLFLLALSSLLFTNCGGSNSEQAQIENEVIVEMPLTNETVSSPFTVQGQARGTWFFEGSFPVYLKDGNGTPITVGIATSSESWMTEDFIPFQATLEFTKPDGINTGIITLEKDNPSGLSEHDASLSFPINF